MDDLFREFLTESNENLLRIEQEIVFLEQRPDDKDLLGSIFRSMHTIKGTCGFLGLPRVERVAHAAENVLGAVRDGLLPPTGDVATDVLAAVDVIRTVLVHLEQSGEEPAGDDAPLVARLDSWLVTDVGATEEEDFEQIFRAAAADRAGGAASNGQPEAQPAEPAREATAGMPGVNGAGPVARAGPLGGGNASTAKPLADSATTAVADQSLRVDVDVLDRLMNLAGELVLTRNQLMGLSEREEDSVYLAPVQQLNRVTTDLQDAVMKTRMQPVGNAWGKLPRLVRDLSAAGGKKIDLVLLGAETELDRQVLEAIRDPLTHMVRNSADHGVESPEQRRAKGKPSEGVIVLEAFHQGGHIVIEIRDDGKGLDVDRIREKVVERGLADAETVAQMPDQRVFAYIFEPGFSTAAEVTAVSGRGVGMDVVRRNILKIGGTVEVFSAVDEGTTFRIKIPLTLAIMSALIVGVRGQSFAIPQIGVLELVRIAQGNRHLVNDVHGALFYRLRDQLLPLVRLDDVIGFTATGEIEGYIVVCQRGGSRFGIVVDRIHDTHEIVVKPVGRMVAALPLYAGTTILGDGRVIMILDVPGIAQMSHALSRSTEEATWVQDAIVGSAEDQGETLLLFDAGLEVPRAVALSQVSRLEEFGPEEIEWADGRWLVQYRGGLLPLVPASANVDMRSRERRQVIVFSDGGTTMGLAVNEIRDIVQERIAMEAGSETAGILGTVVVLGRTTELVDLYHHLAQLPGKRRWASPLQNGKGDRPVSAGRAGALVAEEGAARV